MVLDALLIVVVLVCLFVCFVIACHCKITAYVGDNRLILILSFSYNQPLRSTQPGHPSVYRQNEYTSDRYGYG